jgi:hypothetical protein
MIKKLSLILIIIALVAFSGCTGRNAKVDADNGLKINEFSADPVMAQYNDNTIFSLDVENVGGTTAKCVVAELYGAEDWNSVTGGLMTTAGWGSSFATTISYTSGATNIYFGTSGAGTYFSFNWNDWNSIGLAWNKLVEGVCQKAQTVGYGNPRVRYIAMSMAPPEPDINKPGQFQTVQWLLRPPMLPEGVTVPYDITARLTYLYYSTATANIQVFNRDEYDRRLNLKQQVSYPITVQNTIGAPVKVEITKGTSPVIVSNDPYSGQYEIANYIIEFDNVGDGWPLPVTQGSDDGFIFGAIKIVGDGVDVIDCAGFQQMATAGGIVIPINNQQLIKLRSDKRAPFGCTLGFRKDVWQNKPMGTVSMIFDLYYGYYLDKKATVTVKGRQGYHPSQSGYIV